ncbi:MAG: PD40 domain-containing protein, partial [Bacteroidales bacterium]
MINLFSKGKYFLISLLTILFLYNSCTQKLKLSDIEYYTSAMNSYTIPGSLEIVNPVNETLYPPEIAPPCIRWNANTPEVDKWIIIIELNGTKDAVSHTTDKNFWQLESSEWEKIKSLSTARPAKMSIIGINEQNPKVILSGKQNTFSTSTDSVGAPIFYRDVTLPFGFAISHYETIRWRLGDISSNTESPIIMENLHVCGNCHSFTSDGKTLAMDVDYSNDKGSYVITSLEEETQLSAEKIITWSDYKREDNERTYGMLSQISPDGRYIISTVKDLSVFVPRDENLTYSQLFFPLKGILVYYDTLTKEFKALPGADDREYVHSSATWSPDGKYIVFAKAKAIHDDESGNDGSGIVDTIKAYNLLHSFFDRTRLFKYDLYRIPFNNGKGGKAELLVGASENNKSNYFPRFSPDGKWIVYCQAESFMLLMPDSKLFIIPAEGGTPREMTCNTDDMNSWHSWSPNSKWIVFSSKKRGPYTDLYLTHIDENGNDTPPVLLENLSIKYRAVNIPEFVNIKPGRKITLLPQFQDEVSKIIPIRLANVRDGEFVGNCYSNGHRATVNVTVQNNRILRIEITELESNEGKLAEAIVDMVISKQSLEIAPLKEAPNSSMVVLKSIEFALRKG